MKILLLACALVSSALAAATGGEPVKTEDAAPLTTATTSEHAAVTFIGKHDGEIIRCNNENPNDDDCEVFHAGESPVYSLLVSGEYIYAGLSSGVILRCNLNNKNSCKNFYKGGAEVWSLIITTGHLFAGLADGTILRCDLQQPSCEPFYNVTYSVNTLLEKDGILFAGLASGDVVGCLAKIPNNCRDIYEADAGISGMAVLKDNAYILTNEGQLLKCASIRGPKTGCVTVDANIKNGSLWDIRVFNESLYVYGDDIGICRWVNEDSCETFINTSSAWRFALAYGTHNLKDEYKTEHTACKQGEECQLVSYFNEHERAEFEVYVDHEKLRFKSNYSLVDTGEAAQGHSGPAALFVMSPDGKIYLSNHHQGSIHTSSFLAGNPVSAAGEIVVKYGVIEKIVSCSDHYKPDVELNKQVVESLRTLGYAKPIVSEACV